MPVGWIPGGSNQDWVKSGVAHTAPLRGTKPTIRTLFPERVLEPAWGRVSRAPAGYSSPPFRLWKLIVAALQAERSLIQRNLFVTAVAVGDLLPLGSRRVERFLDRLLARHRPSHLLFGRDVIIKDAWNAGLDGAVRVVVGV